MKSFLCLLAIWIAGLSLIFVQSTSNISFVLAFPPLLTILLVGVPAIILLSGARVKNERMTLLFILLFSLSLRLISPLSDGNSAFVVSRDTFYNFQLTRIYEEQGSWIWGLQTGPALDQLFNPSLQIFSVSMATVTGLDLHTLCRFLPSVVFTFAVILLLFSAFKRLLGSSTALLASFAFAVCYKFNTFNNVYLQESLGVVFFAMAFYALLSMRSAEGSSKGHFVIFVFAVFSIVSTHFFSGFAFLATIIVVFAVSKIPGSLFSTRSSNAVVLMITVTVFYAWAMFIASHLLSVNANYISEYLSQLSLIIQDPFRIGASRVSFLPPLSQLEFLVVYAGILTSILLGALAVVNLLLRRRRRVGYSPNWLRTFGALSLVFSIVTLLGLRAFVSNPDVAYRFVTPLYVFLAPISAVGLDTIQNYSKRVNLESDTKRRLQSLLRKGFIVVLLVVPILSTGILTSESSGKPIIMPDKDVVVVSSWLTFHSNKSLAIFGETSLAEPIAAYSRMDFWSENMLNNETITDVLYYGGNMSTLISYLYQNRGKILLIVDKHFVDQEHFHIRNDLRTRIPSLEATSIALWTLNNLPIVNKVYDGESPSVFIPTNR
jgi:hypothetical protein